MIISSFYKLGNFHVDAEDKAVCCDRNADIFIDDMAQNSGYAFRLQHECVCIRVVESMEHTGSGI